jgi:trans-2-enoyl-CoA reductase
MHLDSIPFMDIYVQILYPLMHVNSIHGQFMKFINVFFCGEKSPYGESNNGATTCKLENNKKKQKSH